MKSSGKLRPVLTVVLICLGQMVAFGSGMSGHSRFAGQIRLRHQLDNYLSHLARLGFSGTVFVADNGTIILSKGYGLSNRARMIPMSEETAIDIGSLTKQFTAAAVLKLEMQGKINVGDTIGKFFPEAPPDKASITLHQLLTHTAGLQQDYGDDDYEPVTREDYVQRIFKTPLLSAPGEQYRYSNAGYSLLAAIIEVVTGDSYERYLHDNIWAPSGMNETGYRIPKWHQDQVAVGYESNERWGTPLDKPSMPDGPYWVLRGNGGVISTAKDIYRWHLELLQDQVLSSREIEKLESAHVRADPGRSYGYGWFISRDQHGKIVRHNGGNGVFSVDLVEYIDRRIVVYVALNTSDYKAFEVTDTLSRIVFGENFIAPPKVEISSRSFGEHPGLYLLPGGGKIDVRESAHGIALMPLDIEAFKDVMGAGIDQGESGSENATLANRTANLVNRIARGECLQAGAAGEAQIPAKECEVWLAKEKVLGKYLGFEIMGTMPFNTMASVTVVQVHFDRGQRYVQFIWEDTGLRAIKDLEAPPTRDFFPECCGGFVAFRMKDGSLRITFKKAESTLVIHAKDGDVRAVRLPAADQPTGGRAMPWHDYRVLNLAMPPTSGPPQ